MGGGHPTVRGDRTKGLLGKQACHTAGAPSRLTLLAVDTRTAYLANFDGTDAGKTAHYLLRWVNPTGEKGPWSETATATIGA